MMTTEKQYFYRKLESNSILHTEEIILNSGIELSISEKCIAIKIPFEAIDSLCYKIRNKNLEISTDLRMLYEKGEELDTAGIGSLLIFGAAVPPLTLFNNIRTFLPGFKYKINPKTFEIKSEVYNPWSSPNDEDLQMNIDDQASFLSEELDRALNNSCPDRNPIVLFSGGVDSSVMAMRILEMGWKEASYVHYSFGPEDKETAISKEIAKLLDVPLDIITGDLEIGYKCLDQAATLYPQPFGNHGAVQSYALADAIISNYNQNRIVIEGSGADGLFGLFRDIKKSTMLYGLPRNTRKLIGSLYRTFNLWKYSSKIEYYIRLLRRSATLSSLPNFVAYNPLYNISYKISSQDLTLLDDLCGDWIHSVSRSRDEMETIPLLDTALFLIRRSVPKFEPIFKNNNFHVSYPFMKKEIIDLALNHTRFWPGSTYPKKALKHLLATKIPPRLVYREKQGFLGPLLDKFAHPVFLNHLTEVSNTNAPLYDYINQNLLKKMKDLVASRKNLALQTYNFLWAITFTNTWLTQLKEDSIGSPE